jgi:alpha-beta hydrolase superfamily lysophospholipase
VRTLEQKLLHQSAFTAYGETLIPSAGTSIALSLYESAPTDPCYVFMPGTMTHPLFYDEFLCAVAGSGFNVVGIHPISHGKSPRERRVFTFADMLLNITDAISYALSRYNDNILLGGSSQGGILVLAAAAKEKRIRAVFPHNLMLPDLTDTFDLLRFPKIFKPLYPVLPVFIRLVAKILPSLPIPVTLYLKPERISRSRDLLEQFACDPIGLTSYPVAFLSSLISADMSGIADGSIRCPVVVIAASGDPLFRLEYTQKTFDLIKAPYKELLLLDEGCHMILIEKCENVAEKIIGKLKEFAAYERLNAVSDQ